MRNKHVLWLLLVGLLLGGTACQTTNPSNDWVQDNGPSVVRTGVSFGTQFALVNLQVDPAVAMQLRGYIIDAKGIVVDGSVPANALDTLADYLNQKIPYEGIRQAIQAGIIAVRNHITIPVSGEIGPEVLLWVHAILDGAIDGFNAYIGGAARGYGVQTAVPDHITFRDGGMTFRGGYQYAPLPVVSATPLQAVPAVAPYGYYQAAPPCR